MAVNLNNFTLNTNFPAIAKTNSASRQCTLSAQTIGSGQTVSASVNISVGSAEICETLLFLNGEYIPYTRHYMDASDGSTVYEYITERISATQIQFTIAATNYSGASVSTPAKTASVLVSAFSVP